MREYPRSLFKGREDKVTVWNEIEEYEAGLAGYQAHWNPEVKKTGDRDVLRVKPEELIEVPEDLNMDDVKEDIETQSLEQQFEDRFGKKAIVDRGPHKGKPSKAFTKFKAAHNG